MTTEEYIRLITSMKICQGILQKMNPRIPQALTRMDMESWDYNWGVVDEWGAKEFPEKIRHCNPPTNPIPDDCPVDQQCHDAMKDEGAEWSPTLKCWIVDNIGLFYPSGYYSSYFDTKAKRRIINTISKVSEILSRWRKRSGYNDNQTT